MQILAPLQWSMAAERLLRSEKIDPLVEIYSRQGVVRNQGDC